MIEERKISVAMRNGTRLAVEVYRPDKPVKCPVLYASSLHTSGPDDGVLRRIGSSVNNRNDWMQCYAESLHVA